MFVILSWSSSGASLEPFSQIHTFRPLDVIILLLPGDGFWPVDLIQLWIWITRITHLMMDASRSFDFSTYRTLGAILGHISSSVEICRSPLICMIIPNYELHVELMIHFHFVLIIQWSPPWIIQSGSYFSILSWFLDGVISGALTPISSFQWSTCQISYTSPWSYSRVIRTDRMY